MEVGAAEGEGIFNQAALHSKGAINMNMLLKLAEQVDTFAHTGPQSDSGLHRQGYVTAP